MSRLTEIDETGSPLTIYAISQEVDKKRERVDVIRPREAERTPWQLVLDIFLPAGFPNSVTEDYIEYQIYDSLQAFASSIAGLLSSRAVLSTLGVGDASSSATNAVIFKVFQESLGRLATIGFAWRLGTSLEPECKMYRLLADVLNDFAFVLDCMSPMLSTTLSVLALSCAGVLRALCGVAAGSSKASLSAHFAKWGNLGELNAKDSSQETVISLLGMLAGTVVVSYVTTPLMTWTALITLLAIHLDMNRRAVRAVSLRTLNRQRAGLVYHQLINGLVPSPQMISAQEEIFQRGNLLRSSNGTVVAHCKMGCSLQDQMRLMGSQDSSRTFGLASGAMSSSLQPFDHVKHFICYRCDERTQRVDIFVSMKEHATARDVLLSWWHAIALADAIHSSHLRKHEDVNGARHVVEKSLASVLELMSKYDKSLEAQGWDLDANVILTRPAPRLVVTPITGSK